MKTCCFIVCYFGKLPRNMEIVLQTCEANSGFDWLLYTDDQTEYSYPSNVHVEYLSFSAMRQKIQEKFDFELCMDHPKKLCDFKPAYGYLFSDKLTEYEFWGYCDLDMYFGDLSKFITPDILDQYEKIYSLGHMTLFRNTQKNNELFMIPFYDHNAVIRSYKQIFQMPSGCCFDEWPMNQVNINVLTEQEKLPFYMGWPMLDILPYRSYFVGSEYHGATHTWTKQDNKYHVVYYDGKHLFACYKKAGTLIQQEVLYAHLQKRTLIADKTVRGPFVIVPNRILSGMLDTKHILRLIAKQKFRAFWRIDELLHKWNGFVALWKHRIRKYILRKIV